MIAPLQPQGDACVGAPSASAAPPDSRWKAWNAALNVQRRIEAHLEAGRPRDDLWTLADFRDADATLSPEIRRRVRSRARYEAANNPLVARILDIWVGDLTGDAGPALQIHIPHNPALSRYVEQAWEKWWKLTGQGAKLRAAVRAEAVDGEGVDVLISNPRNLRRQRISLDVVDLECDRLASPRWDNANLSTYIDGVHLDPLTRDPIAYDLLKAHPGTGYLDSLNQIFEHETFDADHVLHAYRKLRPEQHRGLCRYAPALALAGLHRVALEADSKGRQLRAAFAFVIKSTAPPDPGETGDDGRFWQEVSLPNRQGIGTFMPDGYDITQFRTEPMAPELEGLQRIIAGIVSGCFTMPVGRATGVGSDGYARVRGEMLPYHRTIAADRAQVWEPLYLDKVLYAFAFELSLQPEFQAVANGLTSSDVVCHRQWQWPEKDLIVDPSREESAREVRLATGLTTREDELQVPDIDAHDDRAAESWGFADRGAFRAALRGKVFGPAAVSPAPHAPEGEFGGLGRRQFQNNRKAIRDVLQDFIDGHASEVSTRQMLLALGLSDVRATALIDDARDASIDDPELQPDAAALLAQTPAE